MKRKKKYNKLLFCSAFTPPVNAGGGKNAFNFAGFLTNKGYKVTHLTLNRRGELPFRSQMDELTVIRILYYNYNIISKILSLIFLIPGYFWFVSKTDVVLIYGGNLIGYESLILAGRMLGKTVIFRSTMLGEDDIETILKKNPVLGGFRKGILKLASYYFSINPEFTRSYMKVFGNKDKVIQTLQGVNTLLFHPVTLEEKNILRRKLDLPEDKFVIITAGLLIHRKGFDEIFKALPKLNFQFLYLFVGEFEDKDIHFLNQYRSEMSFLHRMGSELLQDKVSFIRPKENIEEYLQASDVFLLNSKQEGVPNALLEAMSCGVVPVIRTLAGVSDYLIFHEMNAMEYQDEFQMLKCIESLFMDIEKRKNLSLNARESILKNGSFEITMDRIFEKISGS